MLRGHIAGRCLAWGVMAALSVACSQEPPPAQAVNERLRIAGEIAERLYADFGVEPVMKVEPLYGSHYEVSVQFLSIPASHRLDDVARGARERVIEAYGAVPNAIDVSFRVSP